MIDFIILFQTARPSAEQRSRGGPWQHAMGAGGHTGRGMDPRLRDHLQGTSCQRKGTTYVREKGGSNHVPDQLQIKYSRL